MQETGDVSKLTGHLFRHQAGKMLAVLTRIFGTDNLGLAEDVVQESFAAALHTWRLKGIPDNPSAWLFRSAKNKAIDILRKNKFSSQYDFSAADNPLLRSEYTLSPLMEALWSEESIQDEVLKMMFACGHPGIGAESQVTLMLKTLCGFSTAEIARAFLSPEETITKRLYRTREFFREHKIRPAFPLATELRSRTEAVLKAIYLLFNEGYSATHTAELIRRDLLSHAMYLCRLICDNPHTRIPEAYAMMGLMCFHAARIDSRTNVEGGIILLAEQDRSRWDHDMIAEGNRFMNLSASGTVVSSYHLEAAIAYEHCSAPSFEATDWQRILDCYDWLARIQPTPVNMLNRLTVLYKQSGPAAALEEIAGSTYRAEWEKHYLYHSLLAEIYAGTDLARAKAAYEKALQLTKSPAERKLLEDRLDLL